MENCGFCGAELVKKSAKVFCSRTCSNRANVEKSRQANTKVEQVRFWAKVQKTDTCWNWTGSLHPHTGYGYFRRQDGTRNMAHRAAYDMLVGEIPGKLKVLHRCDNPRCVRPGHLFLGTQRQNVMDCVMKGRNASKLKEADVIRILLLYRNGARIVDMARQYGVGWRQIWKIVTRRQWRHVDVPKPAPERK